MMFNTWLARLRAFLHPADYDRELGEEFEQHLELLEQDHLRRGLPPEEARRAARIQLGGMTSLREQHREVRGLPVLEALWQDLRFAGRMIAKDRWFSAAAIAALALGIGVNAVGFTIVNTAFRKDLFPDMDRLVAPCLDLSPATGCSVSFPELGELRTAQSLSALAGYGAGMRNLSGDRSYPERVRVGWVTANLFGILGQQPVLGRDFLPADDDPAAESTVILAYDLWQSRFAGDPDVLGRTLRVDGQPATIVGVMPAGMGFPENEQLWAPWAPFHAPSVNDREMRGLQLVGRLREGVRREQAQAEFVALASRLTADDAGRGAEVQVHTFRDTFGVGRAGNVFRVVMGAVCFVLLIACANVANLLLSRSGYRTREMAVRMSLGATRWRLVRQLLLESLLLAVLGGAGGLLLASIGVPMFEAALPSVSTGKPYWLVFEVDYTVAAYVAAICGLTAILFGLAPALQLSKTASNAALKENARGSHGGRRTTLWSGALVVTELTLAVVLLVGAGLLARSFLKMYSLDLGFEPDRFTLYSTDLTGPAYSEAGARPAFADRLESDVAAIPGIEAAAVTNGPPPRDGGERLLELEQPGREIRSVSVVAVTPRFFEAIDVPILGGRNFTDRDGESGAETVLINERLAQQFFPGQDPIGRRLRFTVRNPAPGQTPDAWRTIVGVTPTIKQGSFQDGYLNAVVYTPYRQGADGNAFLLVRSNLPLASVADSVRRTIQGIDPAQPIREIHTLREWMATERWPHRVFGGLLGILALIALTLSAVGLYAVMAYAVAHRTPEIGVRMAIGARPEQIAWLVVKRGLWQLAIGLLLGLAGGLAVSRLLSGMLVDMRPNDPLTLAVVAVVLAAVSIAACLMPARRASRVDPAIALRTE